MKSDIYEIKTDAAIDGETINIVPMIDVIFAINRIGYYHIG